jgi:hypothetical protein
VKESDKKSNKVVNYSKNSNKKAIEENDDSVTLADLLGVN